MVVDRDWLTPISRKYGISRDALKRMRLPAIEKLLGIGEPRSTESRLIPASLFSPAVLVVGRYHTEADHQKFVARMNKKLGLKVPADQLHSEVGTDE